MECPLQQIKDSLRALLKEFEDVGILRAEWAVKFIVDGTLRHDYAEDEWIACVDIGTFKNKTLAKIIDHLIKPEGERK